MPLTLAEPVYIDREQPDFMIAHTHNHPVYALHLEQFHAPGQWRRPSASTEGHRR
jgi:hypothetical protein